MKRKAIVLGTVVCFGLVAVAVWFFAESGGINDSGENDFSRAWLSRTSADEAGDAFGDTPPSNLDSDFNEAVRQERMENDSRLVEMKNQPWETKNLDIMTNGNAILFLSATAGYDMNRISEATRWSFPISDIKENFPTYAGENVFLDKCTRRGVETVPAGSDLANAISGGREFYIVTFTAETGDAACLYLLTDKDKANKSYYEKEKSGDNRDTLSGWPLGVDSEGRVVIGY